jgi:hypothetical protein
MSKFPRRPIITVSLVQPIKIELYEYYVQVYPFDKKEKLTFTIHKTIEEAEKHRSELIEQEAKKVPDRLRKNYIQGQPQIYRALKSNSTDTKQ